MDDLIRRSDLKQHINSLSSHLLCEWDTLGVLAAVDSIPAVDAVEVVRCRECKYAHLTYDGECKYCDRWEEECERSEQIYLPPDFYCAWGQRKSGGS